MTDLMSATPLAQEAPYPLQSHLGFVLKEWKEDFCNLELPLEPFLMNRFGIPHGGVHAVLLDTVMGYAGCYTGDVASPRFTITLNLNVSFLAQSRGKLLFAEARRTGGGRRIFFAEGQVHDDTGQLVATGTGTFRYRSEGAQHERT